MAIETEQCSLIPNEEGIVFIDSFIASVVIRHLYLLDIIHSEVLKDANPIRFAHQEDTQ